MQVLVKDSDIGLDRKDKNNLFKLFHRGEKATSLYLNGLGLGLFIVKNLIEFHKGAVKTKSEEGREVPLS
ncbi:MAG: ATP-binding protein [Candidatus Nealsonbacteria bacterium]